MNRIAILCSILALVFAALFVADLQGYFNQVHQPIAELRTSAGTVRRLGKNQLTWDRAQGGSFFALGDTISTGEDSKAKLVFVSGGELEIGAGAMVVLAGDTEELKLNFVSGAGKVRVAKESASKISVARVTKASMEKAAAKPKGAKPAAPVVATKPVVMAKNTAPDAKVAVQPKIGNVAGVAAGESGADELARMVGGQGEKVQVGESVAKRPGIQIAPQAPEAEATEMADAAESRIEVSVEDIPVDTELQKRAAQAVAAKTLDRVEPVKPVKPESKPDPKAVAAKDASSKDASPKDVSKEAFKTPAVAQSKGAESAEGTKPDAPEPEEAPIVPVVAVIQEKALKNPNSGLALKSEIVSVAKLPPIPQLKFPLEDAVIDLADGKAAPKLEWEVKVEESANERPSGYEVVLRSADGKGSEKVLKVDQKTLPLHQLGKGKYLWSVRAVASNGKRGPASTARWLEVKVPAKINKPVILPVQVE